MSPLEHFPGRRRIFKMDVKFPAISAEFFNSLLNHKY